MKKLKAITLYVCIFAITINATACASKEESSEIMLNTASPSAEEESVALSESSIVEESLASSESNTEESKIEESTTNVTSVDLDSNDSEYLFSHTDVQGSIISITDKQLTMSQAYTVDEPDGNTTTMMEKNPTEDSDGVVQVAFGEHMKVRVLTMNLAKQSQVSITNAKLSELTAKDEILMFGLQQDESNWMAEQIVILRWE